MWKCAAVPARDIGNKHSLKTHNDHRTSDNGHSECLAYGDSCDSTSCFHVDCDIAAAVLIDSSIAVH